MRKLTRYLAILLIAFYAIPLLIITPLLNILPGWYVNKTWGRSLETEWVILNPFKLSLDIASAKLSEPDGTPFVALGKSSVNLSLASLWREGLVLDTLLVSDLYLRAVRSGDAEFNFSDLLPPPGEESEEGTVNDEVLAVTVHLLDFQAREISLLDQTREDPYESLWKGLDFKVEHLSTVLEEDRPYTLNVTGPEGGTLHWEGFLSIPRRESKGSFSLEGLSLVNLWRLAEPWLVFVVDEGRLDIAANYKVNWGDPLSYSIDGGALAIQGLDVQPGKNAQLADTAVGLGSLDIQDITVDSATYSANIGAIEIEELDASGWMEGERVSLAELFLGPAAPADPNDPNLPDPTAQQAALAQDPNDPGPAQVAAGANSGTQSVPAGQEEWQATIDRVALSNSSLRWRSPFTDPALLLVTPIEAGIEQLNWPLSGDSPFHFSLSVNEEASFSLEGNIALGEGDAQINYDLQGLPISWANANLPETMNASITGGALELKGTVALSAFNPTRITLDGGITNAESRWEDSGEILTSWEKVMVKGLDVDMVGHTLAAEKLLIDNYNGRLHIYEDGSINTSKMFAEEYGDQAEEVADDVEDEYGQGKPWSFQLPTVIFTDSSIDFMDQSLPIPFRTAIGDINGQIQGVSSAPGSSTSVEILGSVDGYAPVTLEGTISPFDEPLDMDLALSFDGVDMALLSPYSGTYAGYKIESGLLNLDLQYKLDQGKLAGDNRIRLGQLKLGEKIDSDKAIDAPLELALSIMTDSNGVIDMQVPVSGDVDDPNFHLGGVITKAVIGVITKAVTAPFTLLANLVGTEEDLQMLAFPTGSAAPDPAGLEKLGKLAEALSQRPKITLSITGRVNPAADRERLQKNALKAEAIEQGLPEKSWEDKNEDWTAFIEKRFARLPGDNGAPDTMTIRDKYKALARNIDVADQTLVDLAEARAVAVKSHLVTEAGLAADRAVIVQSDLADEANRFSGAELGVK